jgi:tripartite-type tricarboxylate transporter receptor subunit TctC
MTLRQIGIFDPFLTLSKDTATFAQFVTRSKKRSRQEGTGMTKVRLGFSSVYGAAALTLAGVFAASGVAQAQSAVENFYKGKRLRVIVSSSPGGGYDTYGRLLAKHIVRFIPGNPTAIVQNMPGGGGVVATNFLYAVAPKDGTVLANIQRTVPFLPLFGHKGPKYDSVKFNWLGSLNNEVTVCIVRKDAPTKSFADLLKMQTIVGGSGPNDTETVPALINNILGAKFKIIAGYPSSTAVFLAMERKEVQGLCSSYGSTKAQDPKWADKYDAIVQSSTEKHPELPNVPLVVDLAKNKADREILELNDARLVIGRPFVLPPGVPSERVEALRTAFDKMVKDKEFLDAANKLGREITPVSGKKVQALITRVMKTDKSVVARLNDALVFKGEKGKAKIKLLEVSGAVSEIKREGRRIRLKMKNGKTFRIKVSGSQTKITVGGKKAKRKAITVGMTCMVKSPGNNETAVNMDCKQG